MYIWHRETWFLSIMGRPLGATLAGKKVRVVGAKKEVRNEGMTTVILVRDCKGEMLDIPAYANGIKISRSGFRAIEATIKSPGVRIPNIRKVNRGRVMGGTLLAHAAS
jgi:hypothetical protein